MMFSVDTEISVQLPGLPEHAPYQTRQRISRKETAGSEQRQHLLLQSWEPLRSSPPAASASPADSCWEWLSRPGCRLLRLARGPKRQAPALQGVRCSAGPALGLRGLPGQRRNKRVKSARQIENWFLKGKCTLCLPVPFRVLLCFGKNPPQH